MKRRDQILITVLACGGVLCFLFFFPRGMRYIAQAVYYGMIATLVLFVLGVLVLYYQSAIKPRRLRKKSRGRADPGSEDFCNCLRDQLRVLRSIGFFEGDADMTDEALAAKVLARLIEDYGEDLTDFREQPCLIAAYDPKRVWHTDLEDDRCLDGEGWIEILLELADISRGAFAPENIKAELNAPEGCVVILFDTGGKRQRIECALNSDWIDPFLPEKLDTYVAHAGYRYVQEGGDHGQCVFVVVVNEDERKRLAKEAEWEI